MVVAADQGSGRRVPRLLRSPVRPSMILVTGATGFAGSHLLERLPSDARVVAWARPEGRPPQPVSSHIEWQAVDLLDRADVSRAIAAARPNVVYHLAGAPHVG